MRRRWIALAFLVVVAAGCGELEDAGRSDYTWVGTITTEGNVTTVVNESGSMWGGNATLAEEASIGVEAGAEEYMLGAVGTVYATDEHIYVTDTQIPQLRHYDLEGVHVGDIGRAGQGPGEYSEPRLLTGDNAGRIFVHDFRGGRFNVYSETGESLDTWPVPSRPGTGGSPYGRAIATPAGTLWVQISVRDPETGISAQGRGEYGPDGPTGEVRFPSEVAFEPVEITVATRSGRDMSIGVPFGPRSVWTIAPSGAIVIGASDRYRFEIQHESGAVTAVERRRTPVPFEAAEADWHRRNFVAALRMEAVPPEWTWNGAEMPATKPAFTSLVAATSGEIWVVRPGAGERLPECVEDPLEAGYAEARRAPCWRDGRIVDVFDLDGRYLGEIELPVGFRTAPAPFIRGNQVVAVVEDEAGTIMVKRYRLVLPAESEQ